MARTDPARTAINLLPWGARADGSFGFPPERLPAILDEAAEAGFHAVMADVPATYTAQVYGSLLADRGLAPAPGYFSVPSEVEPGALREAALRHAEQQATLGLNETFLATEPCPQRLQRPASGTDFDGRRLDRIIEQVVLVAQAMTSLGILPCLHPHVGTWVETGPETRAVLDAVSDALLGFGPDTGHLHWGGEEPAELVREYAERVKAVHLKDVHDPVVAAASSQGWTYQQATLTGHLWAELGRGDVDLDGFLNALPDDFTGWFVVEVDIPDRCTPLESSRRSWSWLQGDAAQREPVGDVVAGSPP